jgi:hypothetical protein
MNAQCHACAGRYHKALAEYYRERAEIEILINETRESLSKMQEMLDKDYATLRDLALPKPPQYACDVHLSEPDFFKKQF